MYKKYFLTLLMAAFALACVSGVAVAGKGDLKVKEEVVIREVCDVVWPHIKNFADMHKWHPAVFSVDAKGGNEPGATRVLTLGDANGPKVYEELVKYSNKAQSLTYTITKVDPKVLPVKNYQARLRTEKEGSRCEVDWQGTFDNADPSMTDEEAKAAVAGVYRAGLENIKKMAMMK